MDHRKALPVLTQLDYWTYLVELLNPNALNELERHENRLIVKHLKGTVLRIEDPCSHSDMNLLALNAVTEFIFEGFKRDSQLANMLVKTTKLMGHIFDTLVQVVDSFSEDRMQLVNKNLLIIYFDKVVKLLHLSLMHPRDYSVEVIHKFLTTERKVPQGAPPSEQTTQRYWIYVTEMFRIINLLAGSCSYAYGQIEVKLALVRFIAELLMRVPEGNQVLDEMVGGFDGRRYMDENEVYTREELKTYGSIILVEMGLVFKGLYLDKDQRGHTINEENEN
jgi:hypothetical protein